MTQDILKFFAPDVAAFIKELAKQTDTTPLVIVRERMRELAEVEKAARSIS